MLAIAIGCDIETGANNCGWNADTTGTIVAAITGTIAVTGLVEAIKVGVGFGATGIGAEIVALATRDNDDCWFRLLTHTNGAGCGGIHGFIDDDWATNDDVCPCTIIMAININIIIDEKILAHFIIIIIKVVMTWTNKKNYKQMWLDGPQTCASQKLIESDFFTSLFLKRKKNTKLVNWNVKKFLKIKI